MSGPVDKQKQMLALCVLLLKGMLEQTLVEAARSKGDGGASWLVEYEAELVRDTKQTVGQGIAIEDEAAHIGGFLQLLQLIFEGARRSLAEGPDRD